MEFVGLGRVTHLEDLLLTNMTNDFTFNQGDGSAVPSIKKVQDGNLRFVATVDRVNQLHPITIVSVNEHANASLVMRFCTPKRLRLHHYFGAIRIASIALGNSKFVRWPSPFAKTLVSWLFQYRNLIFYLLLEESVIGASRKLQTS